MNAPADVLSRASRVRVVVFDVDGVLTDGGLSFDDQGTEYKTFHVRDGHGIKLLQDSGLRAAVITGRRSSIVTARMASLGVTHVYQGAKDKRSTLHELLGQLALEPVQAAYLGDDLQDLPAMREVGLAVAVADAHPLLHEQAHWCTATQGGRGAARELCELIMQAQGTWERVVHPYLQ